MEPIFHLLKKEAKIIWSEDCQSEFEAALEILTKEPVLKQPYLEHQFVVSTDASSYAIGGFLEQYSGDGILHPFTYYSRRLTPSERNYNA
ncbi:Retrovirus-related Pol polyprotein from transposon [Smittium culicis]|uniref:Retrovirus-related Pol polyprotein from transposon n=1 Tax=Smittium culicis TaxID=133412 RepID=A0A1R1XZN5_9FUNG|nr:Retrovirus-related Pol polyprotein from transposon [Smittium culicis]